MTRKAFSTGVSRVRGVLLVILAAAFPLLLLNDYLHGGLRVGFIAIEGVAIGSLALIVVTVTSIVALAGGALIPVEPRGRKRRAGRRRRR